MRIVFQASFSFAIPVRVAVPAAKLIAAIILIKTIILLIVSGFVGIFWDDRNVKYSEVGNLPCSFLSFFVNLYKLFEK